MTRSQVAAETGDDTEPLLWSDVEREIERADRREQRARRPQRRRRLTQPGASTTTLSGHRRGPSRALRPVQLP